MQTKSALANFLRLQKLANPSPKAIQLETLSEPLITHLIKKYSIDETKLQQTFSDYFDLPSLKLSRKIKRHQFIKEQLIKRHHAIPLPPQGTSLYLAISDPTNMAAIKAFHLSTGFEVFPQIVKDSELHQTINELFHKFDSLYDKLEIDDSQETELNIINEESKQDKPITFNETQDAPIVKFINKIILGAIYKNASDIHFEPYENLFRIRARIDGILTTIATPPHSLTPKFISRLKIMAKLDIAERRIPQDGRFKIQLGHNKSIDFRVNTCPTLFGEKIVLRILDPGQTQIGIEQLGLSAKQKNIFLSNIKKPQGLILVTGPTGSGKTVTLYTALSILNKTEKNLMTVEDPVEIYLSGLNQVSINTKADLTFAKTLRAFLRQDPDIIMVGEIRDVETANIAIKAAQTGHLVFATLHTNSAIETITRLQHMGVASHNLAGATKLIIAQRLLRKACPKCKAKGCPDCNNGYSGRVGVYEFLEISKPIKEEILKSANTIELEKLAKAQGFSSLKIEAKNKVALNVTTEEEVYRVIPGTQGFLS